VNNALIAASRQHRQTQLSDRHGIHTEQKVKKGKSGERGLSADYPQKKGKNH